MSAPDILESPTETVAQIPAQRQPVAEIIPAEMPAGIEAEPQAELDPEEELCELARKVQATGDRQLLWQLFAAYTPSMRRAAHYILASSGGGARLEPDDLVHEAMFKIDRHFAKCQREGEPPAIPYRGLMFAAMYRLFQDHLRVGDVGRTVRIPDMARAEYAGGLEQSKRAPAAETEAETRHLVVEALRKVLTDVLPPGRREMLLDYFWGDSMADVVARYSTPTAPLTIEVFKQAVQRVRAKARKLAAAGEIVLPEGF
jgi:DNA-directed RNA polymerase specialized sigma24 family protein